MLARMARRASLTLRKRRMSRMDSVSIPNHFGRESVTSTTSNLEDRIGNLNIMYRRFYM